jgi:tetratricopeptide (TPR) repeat protein
VHEALTTARDLMRAGPELHAGSHVALRRLTDAACKPLAVVVAPAGFGKSTLLRAFAASRSAVFVDLAIGEATFRDAVRLMCEGLADVAPGARLAFAGAYARAAERGQQTSSLGRWLARYLEGIGITIVVDAVDRLGGETRAFAEFAEALVHDDRRGPHLVVAAREGADLPVPRWFADDLIAMPIGADDLRWTVLHARDAARQAGVILDQRSLERIVAAANGRPFDIVYAIHTGSTPIPNDDPGKTLFRSLQPDHRAYVLETCLLRFLDEDVLTAAGLPPYPLAAAHSRLGGLIVRRDETGYRYDEALRVRAETILRADPVAYRRVAERTVDALEAVGRLREALNQARTAHLADRVHRLLREHGLGLDDRGDVDAVDAALEILPDTAEDAVVLLLRATRESRLGRTDTSEAWFRQAIDRAQTRAISAEAAYRLAREIVRRGRSDAVELLEPYAGDESLALEQRCAILSVLAEAYLIAHRRDDAREALRRALDSADRLDVGARAHLFTRASYVELYAGDSARAKTFATAGAELAESASLYVVAFGSYSVLYNVAYDEGGPSESLAYLERLAHCAIRSGNLDFHLYAIVATYELQVERGDVAAIERLERDLREFDVHYGASPTLEGLLPSRALVTAWKGAFAPAYSILAPSGRQQPYTDREALRWAEIALYAGAAGMSDAAEDALRQFDHAYVSADQISQHTVRAAIVARLAAALIGSTCVPPPEVPAAGRLAALSHAVDVVIARWNREAGADALLNALEELRRNELWGMAKLFAALPAVRR